MPQDPVSRNISAGTTRVHMHDCACNMWHSLLERSPPHSSYLVPDPRATPSPSSTNLCAPTTSVRGKHLGLRSNFRTIRIRRIFDELDRIELFLFSSTV